MLKIENKDSSEKLNGRGPTVMKYVTHILKLIGAAFRLPFELHFIYLNVGSVISI
jgi:hypothetical protein